MKHKVVAILIGVASTLGLTSLWPATSASAQTSPVVTSIQVPIFGELTHRVTREQVRLNGQMDLIAEVTPGSSGGGAQVRLRSLASGPGNGRSSQNTYQLVGADNFTSQVPGKGHPENLLFLSKARVLGPSTKDELQVLLVVQVTVNPDGHVAAIVREVKVPPEQNSHAPAK